MRRLSTKTVVRDALSFKEFLKKSNVSLMNDTSTAIAVPSGLKFFVETYGCQMNVSDSDIVRSILTSAGHKSCADINEADVILTNTCAVRENAEIKVLNRLDYFQSIRRNNRKIRRNGFPIIGVLGCMAERLKEKLLEKDSVDFVCGPDAYRDIPRLLQTVATTDQKEANTRLSLEETYADISPVREASSCSAFVSIMRGCNNMCSFCIVPFTRGRERSREMTSILEEVEALSKQGIREIVLLGQNVNGYHDTSPESAARFPTSSYQSSEGFDNLFKGKIRHSPGARFADLLSAVAAVNPEMRVRFTSPHPKDFPDEVLEVIARTPNICKSLHIPLQSGSTTNLQRMRRGYSKEAFLTLIEKIRRIIPGVALSTDVIAGFCGETEEEHADTLDVMRKVRFDQAFMFAYSLREKTHAARTMVDDIPDDVKQRRLEEIIESFRAGIVANNVTEELHKLRLVLVEGAGTKSTPDKPLLTGRTDGGKRVVFPAQPVSSVLNEDIYQHVLRSFCDDVRRRESAVEAGVVDQAQKQQVGDSVVSPEDLIGTYVAVHITHAASSTLRGIPVAVTSIGEFRNLEKLLAVDLRALGLITNTDKVNQQ